MTSFVFSGEMVVQKTWVGKKNSENLVGQEDNIKTDRGRIWCVNVC